MESSTSSHSYLHAFCVKPDLSFETQQQDEEVILTLRAHPITQFFWVFNSLAIAFLVFVGLLFFGPVLTPAQLFVIQIFVGVFLFSYMWFHFLMWYFNVGIVTNKRIIDIDFTNILYKEITGAGLEKVEEVTSKSAGYFGTLFNYGNVFVQTAGEEVNIEFLSIPNPSGAVKIINDLTNG